MHACINTDTKSRTVQINRYSVTQYPLLPLSLILGDVEIINIGPILASGRAATINQL